MASITAAETDVRVPASMGSYEIAITASGTAWTVTEEIAWLEAVKVDNTTLRVSHDENPETVERSGTVTATISDQSVDITITQNADKRPAFAQDAAIADQTYKRNVEIPALTLPQATGGDGALTYSISPELPAELTFNATERAMTGTPESDLPPTTFTYTATDEDGDTAELTFTITIGAVPAFADGAAIADQTYRQSVEIPALTLPQATGGDGALTYSISPELPAGLSFDAGTRRLSGKPESDLPPTTFTYTAADEDGDTAELTFTITIGAVPAFADGAAIADQTYRQSVEIPALTLPQATGGDGALTYSISPELPAGLSFDAGTRRLSGKPE
ncbi:MAG: putative Ig domain-containing protein, partial [Ekhidna sp.]|nr:putative Ig domain-containing protein [Ekhidna sp.]